MPEVENQGIRIHYEVRGQGVPLVLGHSFLCSGAMWEPVLGTLAERARAINVDLRGHGRSGPVAEPFELEDVVGDQLAVLDALGIEKAVWAGLSVGGMVALRAALAAPDRVSGLILLDTHAGAERPLKRLQYGFMGRVARVAGMTPVMSFVLKKMFAATTLRENPALVAEWRQRFAGVDRPSIVRNLQALSRRRSVEERLGEIEVPALVIVGEEDASLPPRLSQRIAEGLPDAALVVVPRAGHLSTLERPEEVGVAMAAFLDARFIEPAELGG